MNISATSKRSFLTLLTAYFASNALLSVLDLLLVLEWLPAFDISIADGVERSLTSYVFSVLGITLALLILIPLFRRKEYSLSVTSKVGLLLMILHSFSPILLEVLYHIFNISTIAFSLTSSGFYVMNIVGLFMFINGSPVEKKLRRFVKWTPFIPVIISFIITTLAGSLNNPLLVTKQIYFFYTAAYLAIVLIVNRMARQELESL